MHRARVRLLLVLLALSPCTGFAQQLLNVPVRINMGGVETVDSYGRVWLGDGPGPGDPLNIRPNDASAVNTIENWSTGILQPDSMEILGFDPTHPGDVYIFNTIRWDTGADGINYVLELPVPAGAYTVNLYFNEACCTNRHFKIAIQDTIVDEDVSYLDYDPVTPATGRAGRLQFEDQVVGDNQILKIELIPCTIADCPDGGDINAILDALEVISGINCDHLGLDFNANYDPTNDRVVGTWNGLASADGWRVSKNGAPFADLAADARSFTDPTPSNAGVYVVYTLQALDGGAPFSSCTSSVLAQACPSNLVCAVNQDSAEVALSWTVGGGVNLTGFEVRRNGALLATLPATASTYEDAPTVGRLLSYSVTPITNPAGSCPALTCSAVIESNLFDVPLRINMGGVQTVDSKGRTWLGDGPGVGDPLSIRPDDASAINTIENWCAPNLNSMRQLGLDPTNPADNYIMSTIRWDNGPLLAGGDDIDFYVELPVPNGNDYFVNLYFNECCCANRHFQIEINGELVEPDVSYTDYGDPPANGKVGRLSFRDVLVDAELLRVGLLPCDPADCPGTGDNNAIINAIEVVKNPCAEAGFRQCAQNLSCTFTPLGAGRVNGFWEPPLCFVPTGYEVYRNGELVASLAGNVNTFQDTLPGRVGFYEVKTLVPEGQDPCPTLSCVVLDERDPFDIPLRLNLGGRFLSDSRGNRWIGDLPGPGDALGIRPDDAAAVNTIENWCVGASLGQADSLQSLGLNPLNPNDQAIFNTIRWDVGDDGINYTLELPVPNGTYILNCYFTECCCFNRHFILMAEGEILDEDVSAADYSSLRALGRTGRLSFDGITVADGVLTVELLPCPDCDPTPDLVVDTNAILDALELLPSDAVLQTCPRDLICTNDGGTINGTWNAPINVTLDGYEVFRNGEKIATLPAGATSFSDAAPPCERVLQYEVAVLGSGPSFLCPGMKMRCILSQPECPWSAPIRVNMGGAETLDSKGNLWLGDGPGPGDPLEIRPDDGGGSNWVDAGGWSLGSMDAASFIAAGLDPTHPGDQQIFNSIRWDNGGDGIDFIVEFPIEDGDYTVNLYFTEACCIGRHFKIQIEDTIVEDDVSYLDYDPAAPALGKLGKLSFTATVADGALNIAFLPCPDCPNVLDTNAIINAIEVLGGGVVGGPKFHRGDADQNGSLQLTDAVQILGYLFLGIPTRVPECLDVADADDNGSIQLTDAVRVLGFLFLGAAPPAPPGPPGDPCGEDPTADDDLGPCTYEACGGG